MGRYRDAKHIGMSVIVLPNEDSRSPKWQQHIEKHEINVTLLKVKALVRSKDRSRLCGCLQNSSLSLCVYLEVSYIDFKLN